MKNWIFGFFGFFIALALLTYLGCAASNRPVVVSPTQDINNVEKDIVGSTTTLEGTTAAIKKDATTGQSKTPSNIGPILNPFWTDINNNTIVQDTIEKNLESKSADFESIKKESDALKADDDAQKAQVAKLIEENKSQFHTISVIGFGLGLTAMAVGIALMFSGFVGGKIIGATGAAVAAACLIGSIVTRAISEVNIYIVFGVVVAAIGGTIWYFIKHQNITTAVTAANTKLTIQKADLEAQHAKTVAENDALKLHNFGLSNENNSLLKLKQDRIALPATPVVEDQRLSVLENRVTTVENKVGSVVVDVASTKSFVEGLSVGMKFNFKDVFTVKAV